MASDDPEAMLRYLTNVGVAGASVADLGQCLVTDRKLRLFACACCRAVWDRLTDPRSRRAVEVAERYADSEATDEELEQTETECAIVCEEWPAFAAVACDFHNVGLFHLTHCEKLHPGQFPPPAAQADLMRCIVGNPWRPVRWTRTKRRGPGPANGPFEVTVWTSEAIRVRTPTVIAVARSIYEDRAFDECPILADVLEEAGCDDGAILSHLRGPGLVHVRGCWAIDLVLGKEGDANA